MESLPLIFNLIIKHAKGNVEQPTKEAQRSLQQPAASSKQTPHPRLALSAAEIDA